MSAITQLICFAQLRYKDSTEPLKIEDENSSNDIEIWSLQFNTKF